MCGRRATALHDNQVGMVRMFELRIDGAGELMTPLALGTPTNRDAARFKRHARHFGARVLVKLFLCHPLYDKRYRLRLPM